MSRTAHRLQTDASGLVVSHIQLSEALDRPYRLTVHCVGAEDLDAAALLETDVVLELGTTGTTFRRVTGMILRVESSRHDQISEESVVLHVGPALALLGLERKSRIFQDKNVPDILREVLEEALGASGRSVDIDLKETYEPREYCVQWQETTLDFVERLMAEEGIAYHFDHAGSTEVLALRDKNDAYPELAANDGATVSFGAVGTDIEETVFSFGPHRRLGRTHIAVRDHDWTAPQNLEGSTGEADAQGRERESYEHGLGVSLSIGGYDEGAKRYQKNDASRQPGVRLEADGARLQLFDGESSIPAITAGYVFELTNEPTGLDGRYLITDVEYSSPPQDRAEDARNRFACIPIDVVHRPARVREKPKITGSEVATVVGPSGEEIHTDAHGRIMVRFPWDRDDTADDHASCWLRVAQRWAGNSFGALFVPRIGMEVVVRYIHGDPDRPVVTGCLYNGSNQPPYPPAEKTKSTIKSNTTLGGGGFNEIRFEDKAGSEQIYLHGQRNMDEIVLNNHTVDVGNDQTTTVHNDDKQTIKKDQTDHVHGNAAVTVKGKRDVTVHSDFDGKFDGTEKRKVKKGVVELVIGGQKRTVNTAVTEDISGGENRLVLGGQTEDNKSHARTVSGNATRVQTGAFKHTASGPVDLSSSSMINSLFLGPHVARAGSTIDISAPAIIEFSSDHKNNAANQKIDNTVRINLFGVSVSVTGVSIGFSGLTLAAVGSARSANVVAVSVTGVSCSHSFLSTSDYGSSPTAIGLLLSVAPAKIVK